MHLMKNIIAAIFLLTSPLLFSQKKLHLSDTSYVTYGPSDDSEYIDSVVFILDGVNLTYCDKYEVYYDHAFKQLAYESYSTGDSCFVKQYWRNGNLKKKTIFIEWEDGIPVWWYEEMYCKNGQIVYKGPTPNQPEKFLSTYYYCNGNKRLEYYHLNLGADGKMTYWYENGQLESEMYFENDIPVGEWKYWNEDGSLKATERYKDGELVETIKHPE